MVRVLTSNQEIIDDLLTHGAYIYKRRYRVEPSHTPPPLLLRCEKSQQYNAHHTSKCPNDIKCGYCSEAHNTKSCRNMQQPPKCTTCGDLHPTFSYKCKTRPAPETCKPELIVSIRTTEAQQSIKTSVFQPITIDQVLTIDQVQVLRIITVTLQNIHPFQRPFILQQI